MRLQLASDCRHETKPPPQRDGFALIMQLQDFADHTLWRDGRVAHDGGHARGTVSIADMNQQIRCEHRSACDNLRFVVDRAALDEWARQEGLTRTALSPQLGLADPALHSLSQALAPSLAPSDERPLRQLFIDQIVLAALTHITLVHGQAQPLARPATLSAHQAGLATGYLADHAAGPLDLSTIADECGLPASTFVAAFQASIGVSPRQWVLNHRLERATGLLLRGGDVEAIARGCGFSNSKALLSAYGRRAGAFSQAQKRRRLN
jgi:AraC-like DNA-binding protein